MSDSNLEGTVWFSNLLFGAPKFSYVHPISERNREENSDIWRKNCRGIPQPCEKFSGEHFWGSVGRIRESPGHVSRCCYSYVVSEPVAAILRQFDLGHTRLYPTRFFEADRMTPIPGQYHCISFGETRESIIVERSKLTEKYKSLHPPFRLTDSTFVVRASSLNGTDLWFDTAVRRTLLLKGSLVAALRTAKVDTAFHLTQCVVFKD
jgi:hypothetical protein